MTPERAAGLVTRWVRFYTRELPAPIAERRFDEIDADLHDHIAHERACGIDDHRIARSIASRMLRGLPADASWRRRTIARSSTPKEVKMSKAAYMRVAIATASVLLLPLVLMLVTNDADWGVFDFVLAGALVGGTGLLLEMAVRSGAHVAYRAAVAAIGVAAIVLGEADDAPGLVLFGCLLIMGAVALTVRIARRGV